MYYMIRLIKTVSLHMAWVLVWRTFLKTCRKNFKKNYGQPQPEIANFARGFGYGLGSFHNFISQRVKDESFRIAERNREFEVGLGIGYGDTSIYFGKKLSENYILRRSERYNQFT